MNRIRWLAALAFSLAARAHADVGDWYTTVYGARISTQPGWEDNIIDAWDTKFADVYLLAAAVSHQYAQRKEGALAIEAEGQVVKYFHDQSHWEFNALPILLRWKKFPWSERVSTSAAFGIGLSYATELPPVEVELEGESHQWLIYWVMELTLGPVDSPWAVSFRLHHRSVAYGLMGDQGGMNALGMGVRYRF